MRLLRSEWTKFRTVPGWVAALAHAVLAIVGLGLGPSRTGSCGTHGPASECTPPVGPDGVPVTDTYTFVHRTLSGDGSVTVRVADLTGVLPVPPAGLTDERGERDGVALWAKAGLMLTTGTAPGSAYAAVMVTGAHGVRMQWDYTHDVAGPSGPAAPRWLRLTRAGDTVTGQSSMDGTQWTVVATVHMGGLPGTAQAGVFVTSPQVAKSVTMLGMTGDWSAPSRATATFERVATDGRWVGQWHGEEIGMGTGTVVPQGVDGTFTVTGSGDVAPLPDGAAGLGVTVTQTLVGTFAGLIVVIVVGVLMVTAEYRRGMVRVTLAATPGRVRVLGAKAVVLAGVAFAVGALAAGIVLAFGPDTLRANGVYVHPATVATQVRLVAGTGALLALSAVLALGIGTLLRRGATAVTVAVVVIVLPYLLMLAVLPPGAAAWVLRLTPAAGFAVQQSAVRYPQVDNVYSATEGYFPLAPWAGLGVLALWAAAAFTAAAIRLRRGDA